MLFTKLNDLSDTSFFEVCVYYRKTNSNNLTIKYCVHIFREKCPFYDEDDPHLSFLLKSYGDYLIFPCCNHKYHGKVGSGRMTDSEHQAKQRVANFSLLE